MASEIKHEEGTYVDCTIQSDAATTANTSSSGKIQKSVSRQESVIFKFNRPSRNPRFIPFTDKPLTGDGDNSHHIMVRLTGTWSSTDDGLATETLSVDSRPATATWNKFDGSGDFTTAGGRDDVKPYSTLVGNLVAGTSGNFRGLPLGRHQVVSMLLRDQTSILISAILTLNATFRLEEIGTGSLRPDLVIKGRYVTRNRENPIRSRRFGVR
jgi:hypothetical protein